MIAGRSGPATLSLVKGHAYGNDFLLARLPSAEIDAPRLARAVCNRHLGVGADGLIFYTLSECAATMDLRNADGSPSELSGNGLRCLAALVAREQHLPVGATVTCETGAGTKTLRLLARDDGRYTFRAFIGPPTELRQVRIPVLGEVVTATLLNMGNPQCVVLGPLPDPDWFGRLGPALATHEMFPAGTNVEFAEVETPGLVRIAIWERGVGPTSSSGTGASASAVAAAAHGGADSLVEVVAPGGTQRVEWQDEGVYLTGWATLVLDGLWTGTDTD